MKNLLLLLFATILCIRAESTYYSQYNQDKWVNENIFKNKIGGIFIDIGAHNGKSINNTYFFETELAWSGICIEPMPEIFNQLVSNRSCICIEGGIAGKEELKDFLRIQGYNEMLSGFLDKYDPRHMDRVRADVKKFGGSFKKIKVQTYNLNNILEQNNIFSIDFLSLDTEGGEYEILQSIDFDFFNIHVISVENNYHENNIFDLLSSKGYQRVAHLGCDEIYVKNM